VLIGASMPSVLAEISFVTNKQEASLLKTGAYRQRIAEALFDAVMQYQRSLKKVTAVADSTTR
ncbi:MAG: N-acetylmuramoyl-L-alanine amidase family protein, partial [Acidobacteriota bacterium]